MATARGHEGLLSVPDADTNTDSQLGHLLWHLVNTSTKPFQVGWNVTEVAQQETGFASTAPKAHEFRADELSEWTASFTAYWPKAAPASGHLGNVTFDNGTVNKVESYSLDFACEEFDDTGMSLTAPTWKSFQPGLWSISGTYRGRVDSSGAVSVGATGEATFRLSTADTPNTVIGTISITSVSKEIAIGSQVFIDYGFQFEGQATSAGTTTLLPAGTLDEPEETEVVMRSTTGRTETGRCFVTGLGLQVAIGQPIQVSGTMRGSGELTPA